MSISELIHKRAYCLVCGEKIPLIRRMSISIFTSVECPSCKIHMTFKKYIFILQMLILILIYPSLSLIFVESYYFLGSLALTFVMIILFLVTYTAEYKIDSHTNSKGQSS